MKKVIPIPIIFALLLQFPHPNLISCLLTFPQMTRVRLFFNRCPLRPVWIIDHPLTLVAMVVELSTSLSEPHAFSELPHCVEMHILPTP